jgi:hypothetical protein
MVGVVEALLRVICLFFVNIETQKMCSRLVRIEFIRLESRIGRVVRAFMLKSF